jgi:branched-chain amino acid transport system substrate-binding protein
VTAVKKALHSCRLDAPQGTVWVDPENNHSYLTPALAISQADGQFEIVWRAESPVKPDPYLVWLDIDAIANASAATRDAAPLPFGAAAARLRNKSP